MSYYIKQVNLGLFTWNLLNKESSSMKNEMMTQKQTALGV